MATATTYRSVNIPTEYFCHNGWIADDETIVGDLAILSEDESSRSLPISEATSIPHLQSKPEVLAYIKDQAALHIGNRDRSNCKIRIMEHLIDISKEELGCEKSIHTFRYILTVALAVVSIAAITFGVIASGGIGLAIIGEIALLATIQYGKNTRKLQLEFKKEIQTLDVQCEPDGKKLVISMELLNEIQKQGKRFFREEKRSTVPNPR